MEPSVVSPDIKNYSMPRGRISFAQMADDGTMAGEVDLGNVTSFDLTNAATWKEHESSGDAVPVLDCKKPANQQYKVKFTPEERSTSAMALFFLADGESSKQQVGSISGSVSKVCYLDRWIDLGYWWVESGSVVVNGDNLSTFLTTDFSVDYENGLLMIKTGNSKSIADLAALTITFTYADYTVPMFVPRTTPVVGFLRYRGTSEVGPRHSIKCWKVQIAPDNALEFIKAQDYSGLSFQGDVYEDDDTGSHSANPNFEITELSDETVVYPPEPTTELIAFWKGEDNTNNEVVGGLPAIIDSEVFYSDGYLGRGFWLNATDDSGSVQFPIAPITSNKWTVSYWIKGTDTPPVHFRTQIFGLFGETYYAATLDLDDTTGIIKFFSGNYIDTIKDSHNWHNIKITYDNQTWHLYKDDVELIPEAVLTPIFLNPYMFYCMQNVYAITGTFKVDEIKIYNGVA